MFNCTKLARVVLKLLKLPLDFLLCRWQTQQTSGTADAVDDADAGSLGRSTTTTSMYARSRRGVFQLTSGGKSRRWATATEWQTTHAGREAHAAVERTTRHTLV